MAAAGFLLCPGHLAVGPIDRQQADRLGEPPPGAVRRPGERLVFGVGEVDHDALISFFDGHAQTPVLFCANSSTGWHYKGVPAHTPNSIPIHIICFYLQRPCKICTIDP